MTMIEKAEKALRAEVERQVQKQGAYSGPENDNPDYVDADLDYPAMCRAVMLAVRDGCADYAWDGKEAANVGVHHSMQITETDAETSFTAMIDAILNEDPK